MRRNSFQHPQTVSCCDGPLPSLVCPSFGLEHVQQTVHSPNKANDSPQDHKRHLVPNRLSIQMPPRAGTVITPTTEVTTETHFMASAILLTPYLSFSIGSIRLNRVLSELPDRSKTDSGVVAEGRRTRSSIRG